MNQFLELTLFGQNPTSDFYILPGIKSHARIPDLQWCYFPRRYLNKGMNKHCYSGNKK